MKLKNKFITFFSALVLSLSFNSASAAVIQLDLNSGWESFLFKREGSAWDTSFAFTLDSDAWFAVTDAYRSGDRFEFFVNGLSVGLTSAPTEFDTQIDGDFDAAFASSGWSSAEIMLSAGDYVITGLANLSPFGSGGAAVQLSSSALGGPSFEPPTGVPAPHSGLLMLGALALFVSRRVKGA